eukprot:scaffold8759_cov135-Isochrysis_galbana.AAC.8
MGEELWWGTYRLHACTWRQRTRAESASLYCIRMIRPISFDEHHSESGQSSPLAFRCFARAIASGLDMPLTDGGV